MKKNSIDQNNKIAEQLKSVQMIKLYLQKSQKIKQINQQIFNSFVQKFPNLLKSKVHQPEQPVVCKKCKTVFKNKLALGGHMSHHTKTDNKKLNPAQRQEQEVMQQSVSKIGYQQQKQENNQFQSTKIKSVELDNQQKFSMAQIQNIEKKRKKMNKKTTDENYQPQSNKRKTIKRKTRSISQQSQTGGPKKKRKTNQDKDQQWDKK